MEGILENVRTLASPPCRPCESTRYENGSFSGLAMLTLLVFDGATDLECSPQERKVQDRQLNRCLTE